MKSRNAIRGSLSAPTVQEVWIMKRTLVSLEARREASDEAFSTAYGGVDTVERMSSFLSRKR